MYPASQARPRVFISSTIFDFADLRSALREWLAERGYEVLASEYNDFDKDFDKNSYDACLDAVRTADVFVLLIGGRRGGWFDEGSNVSITQAEYRVARAQYEQGACKLAVFARAAVLDVLEERKQLEKAAAGTKFQEELVGHTQLAQTNFLQDPAFTRAFLEEVSQRAGMKSGAATSGVRPGANWIHRFSSFRDITDGLKTVLASPSSVLLAEVLGSIRPELLALAKGLVFSLDNAGLRWLHMLLWGIGGISQDVTASSTLSRKDVGLLLEFSARGISLKKTPLRQCSAALASRVLMRWDKERNVVMPTEFERALSELIGEYERALLILDSSHEMTPYGVAAGAAYELQGGQGGQTVTMPNLKLASPLALGRACQNMVSLLLYLFRAMDNDSLDEPRPTLHPPSPFGGIDEAPTDAEMAELLGVSI